MPLQTSLLLLTGAVELGKWVKISLLLLIGAVELGELVKISLILLTRAVELGEWVKIFTVPWIWLECGPWGYREVTLSTAPLWVVAFLCQYGPKGLAGEDLVSMAGWACPLFFIPLLSHISLLTVHILSIPQFTHTAVISPVKPISFICFSMWENLVYF